MNMYAVRCAFVLIIGATIIAACGGSESKKPNATAVGAATSGTMAAIAPTKLVGAATTPRTEVDDLKVSAKEFSFTLNLTTIHRGPPGVHVRGSE